MAVLALRERDMIRWSSIFVGLGSLILPACADDRKDLVRVVCVGDSITYGDGVEEREKNSYPAVLQRLLGDHYRVRNFGDSGSALLAKSDKPYRKEGAYADALKFRPNVVVILLGTNDTKPWNWQHADDFAADYTELIRSFQKLSSQPQVFLCVPVPAYPGGAGIDDTRIRTGVKPKVEELGRELNLPVIDLYTTFSDKKELFSDTVHPNAEGAKLLAETVARAIRGDANPE